MVNPDQTVARIDPRTNRVVARVDAKAELIATGEGDVWIWGRAGFGTDMRGTSSAPRSPS